MVRCVIGVATIIGVTIAVPIIGRSERATDDRTAKESGPKARLAIMLEADLRARPKMATPGRSVWSLAPGAA
jgi:hypothetical protein